MLVDGDGVKMMGWRRPSWMDLWVAQWYGMRVDCFTSVIVWAVVKAAYPADVAFVRKRAWWWVEESASWGLGSWIARMSMLWVRARSIYLESDNRFCWFQVPMQMSDENEEGGRSQSYDVEVEEVEFCALECVWRGCGIVTFLARNGKSYRGKVTRRSWEEVSCGRDLFCCIIGWWEVCFVLTLFCLISKDMKWLVYVWKKWIDL